MLQRALVFMGMLILLSLCIQAFAPSLEAYVSMQVEKVNGVPYLMLQYYSSSADPRYPSFSIYTPSNKDLSEWEPVVEDRNGPAYGLFVTRAAPAPAPAGPDAGPKSTEKPESPERLGLFHKNRATIFDLNIRPPATGFAALPADWVAETAAELNGATYIFGMKLPPEKEDDTGRKVEARLKVARFNGKSFEELPIEGPAALINRNLFSLEALEYQGAIKVLWRNGESDQVLDASIEGLRVTADGPLFIATFDGQSFSGKPVSVSGLPRGNTAAWSDGNDLNVLVQTRMRLEESLSSNSPMEIWNLSESGAKQVESIDKSQAKPGLLPNIAAEHVTWKGQEFILRTNWQSFEVWGRMPGKGWSLIQRNPRGLPVFNLETVLLTMLFVCLGMIAFGAGLAYRRRKQAWSMTRKVQARDVYASLEMRMGAHAVDLCLVLAAAMGFARMQGSLYVSPVEMLPGDFRAPHWPFFVFYLGYLVITEWRLGTTLGKFLMGLRVVMDTGQKLSFWSALVRNLVGFYERLPAAILIPMLMIVFTPRRQRMGDLLARTFVVQKSALEAFKAQRAEELEQQRRMQEADPLLLRGDERSAPERDAVGSAKGDSSERPAHGDKNDKGSSS